MIALSSDCLLFQTDSGESIPYFADMISVELAGGASDLIDAQFVKESAHAVFHYFKHDMGRQTITVGEFAGALEKVLRGFALKWEGTQKPGPVRAADLRKLALESGKGCELFFFPLLRDEVKHQLQQARPVLRFTGLRGCVKQLAGAQRWCLRCRVLRDQILEYLRQCLSAEAGRNGHGLVVEC